MASSFFRAERGYEIDAADGTAYVQFLTSTVRPDTQTDAQDAPIGSLWVINGGTASTTRVYQKFRDSTNDKYDWRDITSSISWLEPVLSTSTTTYANVAAAETALNAGPDVGGVTSPGGFVNGDRILLTDLTAGTEGIYLVNGTPGSGATLVLDPSNDPTDGDAVFTQQGTYADTAWMYNGTAWVQFGSGSAVEEGYIRAFIGKDATGPETPNYESPSETFSGDEPATRDPFTDATGEGTAASSMGYIITKTDNLELAIAKINQELFQNNRHLYATGVTTLADTVPTWVDGCLWMVRIIQGAKVIQWLVHATTDGTNVDYSNFAQEKIGAAITGATVVVTVAGGSLVCTVSSTAASTFMIRRMGTVGVAGVGGDTGFTGALHVLS